MALALSTLVVGVVCAVGLALAGAILRASGSASNRWLAALLVAESGLVAFFGVSSAAPSSLVSEIAFLAVLPWIAPLALAVVSTLQTPLVTVFRPPRRKVALLLGGAAYSVISVALVVAYPSTGDDEPILRGLLFVLPLICVVATFVFSLVASVSAVRRAPRGTPSRQRAIAFVVAFGTRDVAFTGIFFLGVFARDVDSAFAAPLASLAYFVLLAYGILRTQLFDIDLRLKVGISKSTVVTIGLVGVLAAAKVAEFYLNRTYGWIAGGVAAGIMLVLAPRLNRIGDKVASAALPRATGSAEYVADRKLEVYRAAVETAWEDGNLSQGDRAILDKLREKLEITAAEAFELESEVVRGMRAATMGASASAPA